jgi:hypothetical protein
MGIPISAGSSRASHGLEIGNLTGASRAKAPVRLLILPPAAHERGALLRGARAVSSGFAELERGAARQ